MSEEKLRESIQTTQAVIEIGHAILDEMKDAEKEIKKEEREQLNLLRKMNYRR